MLRKTLFFSSLIGRGLERRRRLHRHEAEDLEQVGDDHVAVGAGLLVEAGALAEPERLRHVDLHVIDEVAVPDRLEQAVGEAEGEDVLRRLLAEEMIDAEDLLLGEHLVQLARSATTALARSVPNGFSMMMREPLDQARFAQHPDRRQRRVRRHAQVVQAAALAADSASRPFPRPLSARRRRLSAARSRGVAAKVCQSVSRHLAGGELVQRGARRSCGSLRVDVVERDADDPAAGMKPMQARWNRPGSSLRCARSPVAPNSTTTCGKRGPTPGGIFAIVHALDRSDLDALRLQVLIVVAAEVGDGAARASAR